MRVGAEHGCTARRTHLRGKPMSSRSTLLKDDETGRSGRRHGQERYKTHLQKDKSVHSFVVHHTYDHRVARRPVTVSTILTWTFAWTVLGLGVVALLTLYLSY